MAPALATAMLVVVLALLGSLPARAQDTPRVQVFGGYSYTRFDSPSFGFANPSNLNGYNFSPAYNIFPGFGVVAELSGQYNSKMNLRDLTVGPQILFPRGNKTFFGHLLIGDGRSFVNVGFGEGDTSRAVILGGGMDLDVTPRFAWRVFQVDYVHTALFSATQDNLRLSTGLVYRWHSIRQKGHRAPAPVPPAKQP
jgi:hypothetical protein